MVRWLCFWALITGVTIKARVSSRGPGEGKHLHPVMEGAMLMGADGGAAMQTH